MKKLIMFLAGIALMLITFVMLYITAGIFDTGDAHSIDTYFFQTNGQSTMRLGYPASTRDLGPNKMRDMLIKKYVYEYLYALPDENDIKQRMRPTSTLGIMSLPAVFNEWLATEAPVIQDLANARALRMVRVIEPFVKNDDSDYWEVEYEMKTWYTPNDLNAMPETTRGKMYLVIQTRDAYNEIRSTIEDVGRELDKGRDPATLFQFVVTRVGLQ